MADTKICNKCKTEKPVSDFYKRPSRPCGIRSQCKSCNNHSRKLWVETNKNTVNYKRRMYQKKNRERIYDNAKKRKYSLTESQYLLMKNISACQICKTSVQGKNKHIDHDHETGEVRGILCNKCNLAVSGFEWLTAVSNVLHVRRYLNLEERL